jgi:multiphosphoryl transfer protein
VTPSKLILLSPLQGWSAPLDEVPDAVFSGRMMGDGVAIDPTGTSLHAPCDGTLVVVPESRHAITLRAENGAEILLHIGIDTVGLAGEGFELHVQEGQKVRAGDRLISFDLDLLARRAKSVLTPVILTDTMGFTVARRSQDRLLQVGELLMEIVQTPDIEDAATRPVAPGAGREKPAKDIVTRNVQVQLEHGIHARPAATLAGTVKNFTADLTLVSGSRKANARSPVALMSLGVRKGDQVTIHASGRDAEAAVAAIERALAASASPAVGDFAVEPVRPDARATIGRGVDSPAADKAIKGVVASRGLAVGNAFQFALAVIEVSEAGAGVAHERAELDRARDVVRNSLELEKGDSAAREIAEAHLALLDDPELAAGAGDLIDGGKSAGYAWQTVMHDAIERLRALSDARMAERADDLLDLESRVLTVLGGHSVAAPDLPPDSVLIAHELLPSQLVALDRAKLTGICLAAGGPTSHVAIIATAMDIPMLVAVGQGALRITTGTPVVVDAESGWLYRDPPRMHVELARSQLAERRSRRAAEQQAAQRECRSADGVRVEVFANVGSVAEAEAALRNGAEGCGLLRTEFLFLERTSPPDEAEQLDQYQQIAGALGSRPLTIRTIDVGGDKPIPYLPLPHEENPALGLRGVRTSLWRPDLLRTQLAAILRVRPPGQCRILLPMITDPGEIRAVRLMLYDLCAAAGIRQAIALGAMIETPAAAVMADRIAREADFLSVGTNDLTQYTLAMDRGHPELAPRLDALHPAVLRLIAKTVEAAGAHGRTVAICGGLASDPVAVPILIGLGVHELSMVPAVIPRMKSLISTLNVDDCISLATHALERETAEAVRALTLRNVSGLGATGRTRE